MKETKNKNDKLNRSIFHSKYRKLHALALAAIMATTLAACSTDNNNKKDQVTNNTPVVEETVKPTEDVQQPEVETEVEVEATGEVVEEPETEQTMEEWLTELGSQGICLAVWNDSNGTKRLMIEGEEYVKENGDRFFACAPSLISKLNILSNNDSTIARLSENCIEILFDDSEEDNKITMTITCKDGGEFTINFVIMAVETSTSTEKAEISGFEWAEALGYDSPKMVVWNDTTGIRKELEEGETYQLCEDDRVGLYMPDNYRFDSANVEKDNMTIGANVVVLWWQDIELGNEFNYEITIYNPNTSDKITSHVTLLPVR